MNLIVNEKNNWELNVVSDTNEYNAILTTAGSFVDRNIELHIQTPAGVISAADSSSIKVTPSLGAAVEDAANLKYNVPVNILASATAYANVTTSGYVTDSQNTSKLLSGSGSTIVSIAMYDGTFTIS